MLNLTAAVTRNPRFEPLIDGTITSKILNLQFVVTTPPELFYRNLKYDEFDVFEMSLSELAISQERGEGTRWQWSALPVFPAKAFLWFGLYVNSEAGIRGIQDLRGKRVGVPDYAMTAALWFRSFLWELHGIRPQDISWHVGRTKQFSHGALVGLDQHPPTGVALRWLTEEETFDRMLDRGELDAAYSIAPRHDPKLQTFGNIDRYGGTPIAGNPRLRKLFDDGGHQLVIEYFRKTGSFRPTTPLRFKSVCSTSIPGLLWSYSSSSKKPNTQLTKGRNGGAQLIFISTATTRQTRPLSSATILFPMASKKIKRCWSFSSATPTKRA